MAGNLKLDPQQLESSLGVLQNNCNVAILEAVTGTAEVMRRISGENPLADQLLDNCVAFQSNYNTYEPGLENVISDFKETFDIADWLKSKASIGEVNRRDLGVTGQKISAADIIQ